MVTFAADSSFSANKRAPRRSLIRLNGKMTKKKQENDKREGRTKQRTVMSAKRQNA